jgi:hypothetical protein
MLSIVHNSPPPLPPTVEPRLKYVMAKERGSLNPLISAPWPSTIRWLWLVVVGCGWVWSGVVGCGEEPRRGRMHKGSVRRTCGAVTGCSHIFVFMAGQNKSGLTGSQARATQVSILSQIPAASFPMVLASRGAMRKTSAHLVRSMWRTGSPLSCQAAHSTVSESTWQPEGSSASFRKCFARSVTTTRTSTLRWLSFCTSWGSFIVATLPVQPTKTFFREPLDIAPLAFNPYPRYYFFMYIYHAASYFFFFFFFFPSLLTTSVLCSYFNLLSDCTRRRSALTSNTI